LFLGETDVETFKLVRDANIPDPRQFRQDISEDVVRVLARALAKDPEHRYFTADELARDLSNVMQRLPHPAIYLDLAGLVRAAAEERDQRRKAQGKDRAGVIGDLILETLHDFSGADAMEHEPSKLGTPGVVAGGGDFVDPSSWGLDALFEEPAAPAAPAPPPRPAAAAAPPPPRPAAPAAPAPQAPPPKAPPPAPREQMAKAPEKKEGPFWRRWFGS
jgi:serine/threonine-protein kinase